KTRIPLGAIWNPPPIVAGAGWASKISGSMPPRWRNSATAGPAIPPPTMRARCVCFMRFTLRSERYLRQSSFIMVNITNMNLSAIDLNLFLVLNTVLEERSATRAAARLHVTQSAVSNALTRLRELLGDPLVVRSGRGLVPTPRAEELAPL